MGARSAERMMPLTQTALWGRSFSSTGSQTTSSRVDDEDVVVLLSDETAFSDAAPLISHNAVKLSFCGGVSGALAKTCTAPLARLTILYQVRGLNVAGSGVGGQQMGVLAALRHITATEGVWALWKGNLVTIMHRIPYSATNFCTYEFTKRALQGQVPNESARAWAAGAVSGLVACTAAYPLDLLRTRITAETSPRGGSSSSNGSRWGCSQQQPIYAQQQTQPQRPQYCRISSALRHILAERGVRGLYKGLTATLMQVVPGLAFNFCFYDTFKRLAMQRQGWRAWQQQLGEQGQQQQLEDAVGSCSGGMVSTGGAACCGKESISSSSEDGSTSGRGRCRGPVGSETADAAAAAAAPVPPSTSTTNSPMLSPSPVTSAICACLSGLCTSSLTFPLDVVRRRLQVYERGALGRMHYLDVVRAVYSEGGVGAFYRGLGPEFAKVLPGMAIAFTTYEALKGLTGAS